jgi:hypothetical protein
MNKAMYTICGPILTSFFFEITINPKRLPNRPSMINAGARYVAEKLFKSKIILLSKNSINKKLLCLIK